MLKPKFRFPAQVALVATLLAMAPAGSVRASHDLSEVFMDYQIRCEAFRQARSRLSKTKAEIGRYYYERLVFGMTPTVEDMRTLDHLYHDEKVLDYLLPALRDACDKSRSLYATALSENIAELILSAPAVETPAAPPPRTTKAPPPQTTKAPPPRTTKAPPSGGGHTTAQTQAAEVIGGLIILGIQQGIKSGTRRRPPSGGGSSGSGGGGHHNPNTSTIHRGSN